MPSERLLPTGQYRCIHCRLYDDARWKSLTARAKVLLTVLRQGRQCTPPCIYVVDWQTITEQCVEAGKKWTKAQREQYVTELELIEWIRVGGPNDNVVWVVKGLEHDPHFTIANPKHVTMLVRCLLDVPKCKVRDEFCEAYPVLGVALAAAERKVMPPSPAASPERKAEEPKPRSAFAPPPPKEPLSADAAARERTRKVQGMFKDAYRAATNRDYRPVAIKADATWAKWLHEHYTMLEIEEFMRRAFSGKFKAPFPTTVNRFAASTVNLVKENLKPECSWSFKEPLAEKQMRGYLWAFVKLNADLDRLEFDKYVMHYGVGWSSERLWAYFVKNWEWARGELLKFERKERGEIDGGERQEEERQRDVGDAGDGAEPAA